MKKGLTEKLIDMANKDHDRLIVELSNEQGRYNSGHMAAYIGILFKVAFANVERQVGLDDARKGFKHAVDYIMNAMIDGSYDKENDRIKD